MLIALALLLSQDTQKLPPANPLPYEDADAAAVLAPVTALFAAQEAGDAGAVLRSVYPDGRATSTGPATAQMRQQSWADYAATVTPATAFAQRISNPAIEVDGDIAMVWAPYVVRTGGKVAYCGTAHFDLLREGGVWKVLNATSTRHATGCPAQ